MGSTPGQSSSSTIWILTGRFANELVGLKSVLPLRTGERIGDSYFDKALSETRRTVS